MSSRTRATIEDLYNVECKAELVDGEIVEMVPSGEEPGIAGGEIIHKNILWRINGLHRAHKLQARINIS